MTDILTIPAGVIQPKDLLIWLRDRRDDARQMAGEYDEQHDEYETALWGGRTEAFAEVIQHIQFGGES